MTSDSALPSQSKGNQIIHQPCQSDCIDCSTIATASKQDSTYIEYKLNLHYIHSPNHLNLLRLHIDLVRLNDSIKDFFLDSVCFRPHFYKKHYYFYSITLLPGALMTLCLFSLPTFEFYEAHATFRRVKQEKKRTNHSTLQQNLKAPIKNYFYFSLHSHAFVEWDLHFSCLFFNLT